MVNMHLGVEPPMSTAVRRLSYLKGVLTTKVFHLVEEFSGVTEPQLRTFTGESTRRIEAALAQLMEGELLVRFPVYRLPDGNLSSNTGQFGDEEVPDALFHMHYLSDQGTIIVEHRDISSLTRIRTRVHEDIRKDHADERPQLLHTLQLNDCLASLVARGYEVSAGYRGNLYLPGGHQLVPDARMTVVLYLDEHATELVRGNPRNPEVRQGVQRQILKYVEDARRFTRLQVMYLCESDELRALVADMGAAIRQEYQVDLQAVPVLEDRFIVGPAREGMPEVWRPLHTPLRLYMEYERSAVERLDIRGKLMPLVRVALAGHACDVVFICETQGAADLFEEEHQRLQREHNVSFILITSTHGAVTGRGSDWQPWRRNGQPARLSSVQDAQRDSRA